MFHLKTLAVGGALVAAAAVLSAPASTGSPYARYALSTSGETAWRLDTHTGEMIACRTRTLKRTDATTVVRPKDSDTQVVCFDKDGRVRDKNLF